jgi:hypothetical protein
MVGQIQILDGMFKTEQMHLKMMEPSGETEILMDMATTFLVINQTIVQIIVAIPLTIGMDVLTPMPMAFQMLTQEVLMDLNHGTHILMD